MLHKKVADSAAFFCFRGLGGVYLDLDSPFFEEVLQEMEGYVNFLQIDSDTAGLRFYDEGMLNLLYKNADFSAGKWKLVRGYMSSC